MSLYLWVNYREIFEEAFSKRYGAKFKQVPGDLLRRTTLRQLNLNIASKG